jgi:YD repeat-containing protein
LHYESDRQLGRKPELRIPITTDRIPPSLLGVDLQVNVAGRVSSSNFSATPNQTTLFSWDGRDVYGRLLQGSQTATIELSNRFPSTYAKSDVFGLGKDGSSFGVMTRQPHTVKKSWKGNLQFWDAKPAGLGGWSLNVNHVYDISGRVLRMGDGTNRSLAYIPAIIRAVAGTGSAGPASGDGGPATAAVVPTPTAIAFGPDGSSYVADGHACVRMIDPSGVITTFAGNCSAAGFAGDNGPATSARLQNPTDLAVSPSGVVYIADSQNHRIRRVTPDGIINTIAGSGPTGPSGGSLAGDDGDALLARLNRPSGIDLGSDGVLYIADSDNARIRSVGSDGIIRTVAGGGTATDNEGAATAAVLSPPSRVRFRQDGSLLIAEPGGQVVRRIGPDGIIHSFAGIASAGYYGDGTPAKGAMLKQPTDIGVRSDGAVVILDQNNTVRLVQPSGTITTLAGVVGSTNSSGDDGLATAATFTSAMGIRVAPDGDVYLACTTDNTVRRIGPVFPGFASPGDLIEFSSEDGNTVNSFDGHGRHMATSDALTGAVLLQFGYDGAGRLRSVTDFDDNVTGSRSTMRMMLPDACPP